MRITRVDFSCNVRKPQDGFTTEMVSCLSEGDGYQLRLDGDWLVVRTLASDFEHRYHASICKLTTVVEAPEEVSKDTKSGKRANPKRKTTPVKKRNRGRVERKQPTG